MSFEEFYVAVRIVVDLVVVIGVVYTAFGVRSIKRSVRDRSSENLDRSNSSS